MKYKAVCCTLGFLLVIEASAARDFIQCLSEKVMLFRLDANL